MCGICGCGETEEHHHSNIINLEQDIMAENNRYAAKNRDYFQQHDILAINLVSSPGSGKTTLLVNTISALKNQINIAVVEGDQQTNLDEQRIAATKVPVLQINTGKACHLDAHRIGHAVTDLKLLDKSILFIENVGNLVCPALFDLGETLRVVLLSVTEGADKPLKYPDMFAKADLMLINKIDLLPYVDFDVEQCINYAKRVNPNINSMQLSATKNTGLSTWQQWLLQQQPKLANV